MTSEKENTVVEVLKQFTKPCKDIPFKELILVLYNCKVIQFESSENVKLLEEIKTAMHMVLCKFQNKPIAESLRRPNEVGNDLETPVLEALNAQKLSSSRPTTSKGHGKSAGYPDIVIDTKPIPTYLEIKSYAAKNKDTTQRSFYLSPTNSPKVTQDAYHLLVGFEMERSANGYFPRTFTIVDLYGLRCDLKQEFNADNKSIYEPERILYTYIQKI